MSYEPNLVTSIAILAVSLILGLLANLQMRLPYERRIRGIPWITIQFVSIVVVCIFIMHIVGLITGYQFSGRIGY